MEMFPSLSDAEVEAELASVRRSVEDMKSPRSDATDCAFGTGADCRAAPLSFALHRADLACAAPPAGSFVRYADCSPSNLLGTGAGCSGVYRLVSPVTNEPFAIKVVQRHRSDEMEKKHSFDKETSIFYKLRHPGICRLRTVVTDSTYHLLVIELCEQGELFNVVARGAVEEPVARDYFVQIIEAADYCHKRRIYHRDLKLENVLVASPPGDPANRIKISDFGMARDCGVNSSPATRGMGTVSYMAPEIAGHGTEAYDGAAIDVWSMGVMLYVMVVCNYPFGHDGVGGSPVRDIIARASRAEFRFPGHMSLSGEIRDLITGMLTVDPRRRLTIAQIRSHPWVAAGGYCLGGEAAGGAAGGASMDEEEEAMPELNLESMPPLEAGASMASVPSWQHMVYDDEEEFLHDDEVQGF